MPVEPAAGLGAEALLAVLHHAPGERERERGREREREREMETERERERWRRRGREREESRKRRISGLGIKRSWVGGKVSWEGKQTLLLLLLMVIRRRIDAEARARASERA